VPLLLSFFGCTDARQGCKPLAIPEIIERKERGEPESRMVLSKMMKDEHVATN
jgi:hypothetical protein